jgi:hypothetical protein
VHLTAIRCRSARTRAPDLLQTHQRERGSSFQYFLLRAFGCTPPTDRINTESALPRPKRRLSPPLVNSHPKGQYGRPCIRCTLRGMCEPAIPDPDWSADLRYRCTGQGWEVAGLHRSLDRRPSYSGAQQAKDVWLRERYGFNIDVVRGVG